jgi:hypothetical protein
MDRKNVAQAKRRKEKRESLIANGPPLILIPPVAQSKKPGIAKYMSPPKRPKISTPVEPTKEVEEQKVPTTN